MGYNSIYLYMSYYVYIHTCPNNKRYIGITTQKPEYRWKSGKGYGNQTFGRAVHKYGWDNIDHKVFEVDTESEMYYLEKYLISYYQTTNRLYGYNKSTGGEIGPIGNKFTEEQRENLSKSLMGHIISDETKKKISDGQRKTKVSIDDIEFDSIRDAAEYFGFDKRCLAYCLKRNKYPVYKGHKIKYL